MIERPDERPDDGAAAVPVDTAVPAEIAVPAEMGVPPEAGTPPGVRSARPDVPQAPPWSGWSGPPAVARWVLISGLVILTAGALLGAWAEGHRVLDVVAGVVACLAVAALLREVPGRRTDAIAIGLGLAAVVSPAVTPAASLVTLWSAQVRPWRPALAVAVAGTVGHLVFWVWRPTHVEWGWWAVVVVAVQAALLGWGRMVRARARLVAHLREQVAHAEEEQRRRVAEARLAERARLAREMHDGLAHRLSLLSTWAGALEYRPDAPPEELARAAGVLRTGLHGALEELREVVGVLRADDRPAPGDARGHEDDRPPLGATDVRRLLDEARAVGERVEAQIDADLEQVPPGAGRTAYRVVQEGLTNARRHAPGCTVTVRVRGRPGDGLEVEVTNELSALVRASVGPSVPGPSDGSGPTVSGLPEGSGAGLVGLQERADLLGGRIEHGELDGRFRLAVWLPWRA